MTTQALRTRLDSILQFMAPHWSWVNCHMVNYLTDDHWTTHVPLDLQREISAQNSIEDCIEIFFWDQTENVTNKLPRLSELRRETSLHSLHAFQEIIITPQYLKEEVLGTKTSSKEIKIKEFLTEKKRHEVEITAKLINEIITSSPWQNHCVIVDAGDGKGYLSSRLALEYGHKVLGIDSNAANTENAIKRSNKLKKAWNALRKRAEMESKGLTPTRRGDLKQKLQQKSMVDEELTITNENNYKTTSNFITSDMDLDRLVTENFFELSSAIHPAICLTGLHTCGNLASTCLKLFNSQNSCKILCNIGCCYHLLKEEYSSAEFFENKQISDLHQENGFPLSQYLKEKKFTLGRNARMLAAQSVERSVKAKELPNISLYYRALLELLICEEHPTLRNCIQVGKIRKFSSFVEYVDLCRNKYSNLNLKNERIVEIEESENQRNSKSYLDIFYLLRMMFAPVLESIILLDRLLFLKECGHNQSFLIPVFDPVVSPRHFAIVALKN